MKDWLSAVLLSTDPKQRVRILRSLLAASIYVMCIGIMIFASHQGLMKPGQGEPLYALLLGNVIFWYVLLRAGFSHRFKDGSLTMPQILAAITLILAAYAITAAFHGAILILLTLVLVFGIFSLNAQGAKVAGAYAVFLTAAVMIYKIKTDPINYPWALEAVHFALVMSTVPTISVLTAQLSNLRAKLRLKQDELTKALDRIQVLATRDELTGLYNRRHMMSVLADHQSRRARSDSHQFCLAILDIDLFKQINDAHGHGVGDEVLRNFSNHAAALTRETDVLARWGGEEFMLVMVGTSVEDAERGIQRIRDSLRNVCVQSKGMQLHPEFSAGLAEYAPEVGLTESIERADQALYQAKQTGRNRTVIWTQPSPTIGA